jgi:hypothetical protein
VSNSADDAFLFTFGTYRSPKRKTTRDGAMQTSPETFCRISGNGRRRGGFSDLMDFAARLPRRLAARSR